MESIITPNWPAPAQVKACTTLRTGGVSIAPWNDFNLAQHVGDNTTHVQINREILQKFLNLPAKPVWLQQTHSTIVVPANDAAREKEADASFTDQHNQVCVIMTADCLPVLFCDRNGTKVAAAHAGWRGLANGILERTLEALQLEPADTLVWLGPAIGAEVYEVGDEVRDCFIARYSEAEAAFKPTPTGRWLADMYGLAQLYLRKQGVTQIYGGEYCTYSDQARFFSYRRDGNKTGRMASLIWLEHSKSTVNRP